MLKILFGIIDKYGDREVMETFLRMRGILSFFERLSSLPQLDTDFIRDTPSSSYFFYRNTVCKVTRDAIELIPYGMNGYIWISQIIDHHLEVVAIDEIKKNLSFYRFFVDITAHQALNSESRFSHLQLLIGYLLHEYKDPINPKAVVLMVEHNRKTGRWYW